MRSVPAANIFFVCLFHTANYFYLRSFPPSLLAVCSLFRIFRTFNKKGLQVLFRTTKLILAGITADALHKPVGLSVFNM